MNDELKESLSKTEVDKNVQIHIFSNKPKIKCGKIEWSTYISLFIANLLLVAEGAFSVWYSPVILNLQSKDPATNPLRVPITPLQTSILTSCAPIACTLSVILAAKLCNNSKRKIFIKYTSILILIDLTILSFAENIYIYYVCLLVLGSSQAGIFVICLMYYSEISSENQRGAMGCLTGFALPFGMLYSYILGPILSVKYFTLSIALFPALNILLSRFIIESPVYLLSVGNQIEALKSLKRLRSNNYDKEIELELKEMIAKVSSFSRKKSSLLDLFRSKTTRKGVLLSLLVCVVQQISGLGIIYSYMGFVFNAAGSSLSGNSVGVLVGFINLSFFLVAALFVEKAGRRFLYISSGMGCVIFMFFLGISFYLKEIESPIYAKITWFPVLCVIAFTISYGFGMGPIPIAFLPELFTIPYRSAGMALILIVDHIIIAGVLFSFPLLSDEFGIYSSMFAHSLLTFIGIVLIYFFMPETRGLTMDEVQKILAE